MTRKVEKEVCRNTSQTDALVVQRDARRVAGAAATLKEVLAQSIRTSGTITAEHGIGVAERQYPLAQAVPAQMRVLRELRKVLHPSGILNPGKALN